MPDRDDQLRVQIGQHAMASMDILDNQDTIERVSEAVDVVTRALRAFVDAGWTVDAATGFLIGVFLAARNQVDEDPHSR